MHPCCRESSAQTIERCNGERETNTLPTVIPVKADISKYDIIFLGYPVWYGVAAHPVLSIVENEKFAGKKVVTICTFGSGDPVSVASRPVNGGTEYKFLAQGKGMDGQPSYSTIFVLALDGETPEFTNVIRYNR